MQKKEIALFNILIFMLFSVFNQIKHYSVRFRKDFLVLGNGFSYNWLIILYFFGSYLGKYNEIINNNKKQLLNTFIWLFISFLSAFFRNIILIYKLKHNEDIAQMRVEYTSPSSVIISLSYIINFFFLSINIWNIFNT